jgi:tetratricopeptide (TPR) repeat protein
VNAQLAPQADNAVDPRQPWLGLASFTEETRAYFHGREEEVAELARRVQRKLLTILFGQSGLGKTSILRAGIVPRLRPEGYCPVYVRIDYSPESPPPAEQIKQAIFRATQASGAWTQPGTAVAGESLWEFLHHRDDVLRDGAGKPLIPLLIFDQFEEIFTLAQADDAGRRRAAEFIEDLADLVENRPPKALEARLEHDDTIAERFDFGRADYRILIALREDYLAHLEGVKGVMPSITQNRMRLARMNGQQALAAVMKPGGKLVSEEVAESIVRFISGGSELRNAEVEPSLLSLICRELNNARIAQGRSEISADLLAGSHDTILNEFYERALADQPPAVRKVIEDQLLTDSGFRESLAEERVVKAFAAAGAPPDALATLVNRRLLRIEERLDVRRVELTHDVLCGVVKASRAMRLEREARDEAERQLAAQREREAATRRALVRARQVAAVCAVLAIGAIVSAIFGYQNMQRARAAEANAQAARGEAEKLIVYLLDDFYLELEPVGRLDIVAELARRAVNYYRELPAELRTPETNRNRALALVRYGAALRYQSKLEEGEKVLTEAIDILSNLRKGGDQSEVTAIGLGLGYAALARTRDSLNDFSAAGKFVDQAAETLQPLVKSPTPSVALRRAYGSVMIYRGFSAMRGSQEEAGVGYLEAARGAFRSIDDLKLGDLSAAASYTEATAWEMEALTGLGRTQDASRIGEEAVRVATQVLEKRPAHMGALRARGLIQSNLAQIESNALHLKKALPLEQAATRDWESFTKLDPGNSIAWNNLAANLQQAAGTLQGLGRLDEARAAFLAAGAVERNMKSSAMITVNLMFPWGRLANLESDVGNQAQARAALAEMRRLGAGVAAKRTVVVRERKSLEMLIANFSAGVALNERDYSSAISLLRAAIPGPGVAKPEGGREEWIWNRNHAAAWQTLAEAHYGLKEYSEAEKSAREAVAYFGKLPQRSTDQRREASYVDVLHAMALARLDRQEEARKVIEPALKLHRSLATPDADDLFQRFELARALFASALASPSQAQAQLAEANAIIDRLPDAFKRSNSVTLVRGWIVEEQKLSPSTGSGRTAGR